MKAAVALFAKAPHAGRVKTRMVPPLTPEVATRVALGCLEISIRRFVPAVGAPWTLFLDGAADGRLIQLAASHKIPIARQVEGGLGARLWAAFAELRAQGHDAIVAIGSDSPSLNPARIREAIAALETHDVALGPCEDGGYYLIGVRGDRPEMFEAIPWSTPQVARATLERAATLGCSVRVLPPWYDVDDLGSLTRAIADVDPAFRALIEPAALGQPLST